MHKTKKLFLFLSRRSKFAIHIAELQKNIAPCAPILWEPLCTKEIFRGTVGQKQCPNRAPTVPPSKIRQQLLRIRERSFGLTHTVVWANANGCEKASESLLQRHLYLVRTGLVPYKTLSERSKGTIWMSQRRSQPHRARQSHQEAEMAQKQSQRHPRLLPPPQKTIVSNGGTVGA